MSVLIKNMEMPKNCGVCRFAGSCGVHNVEEWPDLESIMFNDVIGIDGVRDPDCPLVPVPPHGRLIDADKLKADNPRHMNVDVPYVTEVTVEEIIDAAPTVIEAEEVYNKYADTAGNLHWTGTKSGEHTIRAEEEEKI